jgi:hypothetical protein
MDIEVLHRFNPTISTSELMRSMSPNPEINDVIKTDFKSLLELKLIEVQNLYKADKKTLKFRHDSNLVVSKFEGRIKDSPEFEVFLEKSTFFECGINYLGRLRKVGQDYLYIRIPGEGTYDPASREPYLSKQDYAIITGFYSAALYALRRGGLDTFEKIFKIFKLNKVYKNHKFLVMYMKYQIFKTFVEGQETKDYGLWLREDARYLKSELMKKEYEDLTMYLNLFELCEKTEIFPCQKYVKTLLETREKAKNDEVFKFITSQKESEIYLLPDTMFVKRFSRLGEHRELYDMREMIRNLDTLEVEYSNKIKEAMRSRPNQGSEMKDLVKSYYECRVF